MQPEWQFTWDDIRNKPTAKGLHYTGRAFDFHTGAGCMADSKALMNLKKVGYNANKTPAYAYYVVNNGPRRWEMWATTEDITVPERELLAVFCGWAGGSTIFCEKVTGRFINVSAIMAKHGWRVIKAHGGLTQIDHIEKECTGPNGAVALSEGGLKTKYTNKWSSAYSHLEWWHWQFTGDLVRHVTTYKSQLTTVRSMDNIMKRWGHPSGVAYWKSSGLYGKPLDSPGATYGRAWG